MDGMLSQDEINALLNGMNSDDSSDDNADSAAQDSSMAGDNNTNNDIPDTEEVLSDYEKDAVGEISNISMGTAATTLSSLLNQKVNITTPRVEIADWEHLSSKYDRPCVMLQIRYKEGLDGNNVLILKEKDVKIITDFLPHHSKEELYGMVDRWSESFGNRKLKDFFGGILNGKVVAFIARKLSMAADKSVAKVDKSRLYNFVDYAKECEFNITGSAGLDIAQVTSGGVNLSEINPETCESKIVENLYFAGEIMDVDGPCGGYNLHFAWSSGIAAGKSVH